MNATDTPAIVMRGITKHFGAVQAVRGVDIVIQRGETVALLGPNGAGKSTTISMLLGLLAPTAGTVTIFGLTPEAAIRHSRIGAMLQDGKLMPGVRVGEFLEFVRSLHPHALGKRELIDLADLGGLVNRRIDRLSGGETQRVRFATAIAGDPDILVLDEPTASMDVESRREFWARMRAFAARGHTVLFATHYLEEAENFASRLLIIAAGQVVADGTVREIQDRFGEPRVSFTLERPTTAYTTFPGVSRVELAGDRVTLHTRDADATVRALVSGDVAWSHLDVKSIDLEETFVTLINKGAGQ